jgi:hypothetical protein
MLKSTLLSAAEKLRLFRHFFSSARKRGLFRTLQISAYEFWYSRKFGGYTGRVIPVHRLGYSDDAAQHAQPYFPSSFMFMHEIFSNPNVVCNGATLVDYGSGMGRVMLFAATLPFQRIIGVEISSMLCEIATKNIREYYRRSQKHLPSWSVVNMDVRQFEVPEDATIFYLYNPFDATVLTEVLDRILQSVSSHPRRCIVIYANPVHEEVFMRRGLCRLFGHEDDFAVYELKYCGCLSSRKTEIFALGRSP